MLLEGIPRGQRQQFAWGNLIAQIEVVLGSWVKESFGSHMLHRYSTCWRHQSSSVQASRSAPSSSAVSCLALGGLLHVAPASVSALGTTSWG